MTRGNRKKQPSRLASAPRSEELAIFPLARINAPVPGHRRTTAPDQAVPDDIPPDKEQALIRECLAGNSEAFRPLVERYEHMVRGMIARLVDEDHLIEELAHCTFMGAYENLAKYEGRSKFATWLGRIAINKTRDYLRARKRRDRGRVPLDEFDAPHEGYCLEAEIHGRQSGRLLARAMQNLKDDTRRLIVLRYLHECPYREIAERIGCSEGAAKVRCWRAVTVLRRELERLGAEP